MGDAGATNDLSKIVLCVFGKEGKTGIGGFHLQLTCLVLTM